jgi:hypothetical protein
VVEMVLNEGANVNVQGGEYDNVLQTASQGGHKKMLLDNGAAVNAPGGPYETALVSDYFQSIILPRYQNRRGENLLGIMHSSTEL